MSVTEPLDVNWTNYDVVAANNVVAANDDVAEKEIEITTN